MSGNAEYTCFTCSHQFPWWTRDGQPRCPRCGSSDLKSNPWLLLQDNAEGLTDDDHLMAGLAV